MTPGSLHPTLLAIFQQADALLAPYQGRRASLFGERMGDLLSARAAAQAALEVLRAEGPALLDRADGVQFLDDQCFLVLAPLSFATRNNGHGDPVWYRGGAGASFYASFMTAMGQVRRLAELHTRPASPSAANSACWTRTGR